MLRQNNVIKGFKLNEKEILLAQFADDTTLCLDGSEQTFNESIHTLQRFAQISGLKMNNDKTCIVWIGSKKHSQVRFMRDMNFCWDPGIFKILGVTFSTDTEQISTLNYDGKLQEIKHVLTTWNKRYITPLGKITTIKTVAVSKIIHLFITCCLLMGT